MYANEVHVNGRYRFTPRSTDPFYKRYVSSTVTVMCRRLEPVGTTPHLRTAFTIQTDDGWIGVAFPNELEKLT